MSRITRWCAISFLAGIAASEWITISWMWLSVVFWVGVISLGHGRKTIALMIGCCVLFFGAGIMRGEGGSPNMHSLDIGMLNDKGVKEWEGVIVKEPDVRETKQKITVRVDHHQEGVENYDGLMLVEAGVYPWFSYGDRLQFRCRTEEPFITKEFSYKDYLARQNIFSWCRNPANITLIDRDQGSRLLGMLFASKQWLMSGINTVLSEPHSTLLSGILFGARSGFPKDVAADFSTVGLTHIVAVSGYNITLVMVAITCILKGVGVGRKRAMWAVLVGISMFTLFTGAASSAVRAALMGGLVLFSQYKGRTQMIGHTLVVVATLMVALSPPILLHDAGFQLSFLATLGLVYGSPIIARVTDHLPLWRWIKELIDQTLSAIIFTAPLIIVEFSSFSLIALVANILILPTMSLMMALGLGLVVVNIVGVLLGPFSVLWHLITTPLVWFTWLILQYILSITHFFAGIPYASLHITLNEWSWVFFVLTYTLLFWGVWILKKKS
ncbi:MAG: ComEC/Rec2 family competence protein [Patescibacteria group bacterium]